MASTLADEHDFDIVMGDASYGKSDVRLVKILRDTPRHEIKDVCIDIQLEGDFDKGYVRGDNSDWMSTDTLRNIVYALAKHKFTGDIETFGTELLKYYIHAAPLVRCGTIVLAENLWRRIEVNGVGHDHSFVREPGRRTALVRGDGSAFIIEAGVEGLSVLKSTQSGWTGYLKDQFTTLPETTDRILATEISARWRYAEGTNLNFDHEWNNIREQIMTTFTDHYSSGVQNDIYLIGRAVLDRFHEVERISFSLPNRHHLLFDLEQFGMSNDNEIFYSSGDPHGLLTGTVERA